LRDKSRRIGKPDIEIVGTEEVEVFVVDGAELVLGPELGLLDMVVVVL